MAKLHILSPTPSKDEELENFITCFRELERGEIFYSVEVFSLIPSVYRELERGSSGKKVIIDSRGEALRLALDTLLGF